jgi:DNA-binding NarL/FixJ family response regulator
MTWLDGRGFTYWLDSRRPERLGLLGESTERRLRNARALSGQLSVHTVDRIVTTLGLHLSDVPDEVWVERRPRRFHPPVPPEERERAVRLRLSGTPATEIARTLGVSDRAVRSWVTRRPVEDEAA